LKELFDYIEGFKPLDMELETKLKPFIPEYIPAVGDIDAFIKVGHSY
jgi:intraflagellar transport protein 46